MNNKELEVNLGVQRETENSGMSTLGLDGVNGLQ